MPVTPEQNIAIRTSIRNDLRYIKPGVPMRYTSKRGTWRPALVEPGVPVDQDDGPSVTPEGVLVPAPVALWQKAVINIATAAIHVIIEGAPGRVIRIGTFFFTVSGAVDVTFYDGASEITGAMDLGDVSEPRGIVVSTARGPIRLQEGNDFSIGLSANVQVSGLVTYRVA